MVYNPDEVEKDFSEEEIFELVKGGIEDERKEIFKN